MVNIVTSYVNPDTDGVASALAIAAYPSSFHLHGKWDAVFSGVLNPETKHFLSIRNIEASVSNLVPENINSLTLVDTHERNGLPKWISSDFHVQLIIDHHMSASSNTVSADRLINEEVGAAATIVAEFLIQTGVSISADIAYVLQMDILSNTSLFSTSSTTQRDRDVLTQLGIFSNLDNGTAFFMAKQGREKLLATPLDKLILGDVKRFSFGPHNYVVSQVEGTNISDRIHSLSLKTLVHKLAPVEKSSTVVINLVDIPNGCSYIYIDDTSFRHLFYEYARIAASSLPEMKGDWVVLPYVAIRKTHIIPWLSKIANNAI